jgi:hypothetical protein
VSEPQTEPLEVEKQRVLRRHALLLSALTNTPAFVFLYGEIEKKQVRMSQTLTARLLGGEALDTLQRQIDYDRGFIDGMLYPRQVVEAALRTVAGAREEAEEPEEAVSDGWSRGSGDDRDDGDDGASAG